MIDSSFFFIFLTYLLNLNSIKVKSFSTTMNLQDMCYVENGLKILKERIVNNFDFDAEMIAECM